MDKSLYFTIGSALSSMRRIFHNMSTSNIHLVTCLVGGVSCLLPLFIFPTSNIEDSSLRIAMPSHKNKVSSSFFYQNMRPYENVNLTSLTHSSRNAIWLSLAAKPLDFVKTWDLPSCLIYPLVWPQHDTYLIFTLMSYTLRSQRWRRYPCYARLCLI